MLEKLILTGLLIFIDQGSTFQAFCGGIVAFSFFAVQCSTAPFVSMTGNLLKAVAEAQLFITLLISIVLRTNVGEDQDSISADDYGTILTVVFFVAPATFTFCCIYERCCHAPQDADATINDGTIETKQKQTEQQEPALEKELQALNLRKLLEDAKTSAEVVDLVLSRVGGNAESQGTPPPNVESESCHETEPEVAP